MAIALRLSFRLSGSQSSLIWIGMVGACIGAAHAAGPTGLLNDSGQTQCDNGSNFMVACTAANVGDTAVFKRQDGRFGRDPAAPLKVGGGSAGFDFTRICFNGEAQGAGICTGSLIANTSGTASGTPGTDWACTRDNVTNLVWSLQSQSATWTVATDAGFAVGHNAAIRCGFGSGWRVPTRRELLSIVHYGVASAPVVDTSYLPFTQSGYYWSSETYAPETNFAWIVNFSNTNTLSDHKSFAYSVRLVRGGL